MRMTIGRRITLAVVASVLITLALVMIATQALEAAVQGKNDVIERSGRLVAESNALLAALNEDAALVRGYLLTGDETLLGQRAVVDERFRAALDEIQDRARDREAVALAAELPDRRAAWERVAAELIARRADGADPATLGGEAERRLLPSFAQATTAATQIADREATIRDRDTAAANVAASAAAQRVWVLGGIGVLLVAGLGAGTVRQTNRRVEELARAIDEAGAEILAGTEQQAASAAELAAAVQQTVATVEELSQSAQETAQRSRAVADSAQRAADTAEAGQTAVRDSVAGMEEVRGRGDEIASHILALAERGRAVADIIATVEDIAEQTHLLALNASIEAARAGEHGRGFSVVATEVRALADESRRATTRISEILGEIQRATDAAVLATEEGTRTIQSGTATVTSAGTTIDELNELMGDATLAAEQIAGSAGQQATATSQITQAMHDVRTAIDQSSASARQAEQTARELTEVSERLKALVGIVR